MRKRKVVKVSIEEDKDVKVPMDLYSKLDDLKEEFIKRAGEQNNVSLVTAFQSMNRNAFLVYLIRMGIKSLDLD